MGILKKVLGGHEDVEQQPAPSELTEENCPHTALITHWDEPGDLGKKDKATYTCESCGRVFNYEQARQFLEKPPAVLASVRRDR
jgi:hypothetical protein